MPDSWGKCKRWRCHFADVDSTLEEKQTELDNSEALWWNWSGSVSTLEEVWAGAARLKASEFLFSLVPQRGSWISPCLDRDHWMHWEFYSHRDCYGSFQSPYLFFQISGWKSDPVFEGLLLLFLLLFSALTMADNVYYCFINTKMVTNE